MKLKILLIGVLVIVISLSVITIISGADAKPAYLYCWTLDERFNPPCSGPATNCFCPYNVPGGLQ